MLIVLGLLTVDFIPNEYCEEPIHLFFRDILFTRRRFRKSNFSNSVSSHSVRVLNKRKTKIGKINYKHPALALNVTKFPTQRYERSSLITANSRKKLCRLFWSVNINWNLRFSSPLTRRLGMPASVPKSPMELHDVQKRWQCLRSNYSCWWVNGPSYRWTLQFNELNFAKFLRYDNEIYARKEFLNQKWILALQ